MFEQLGEVMKHVAVIEPGPDPNPEFESREQVWEQNLPNTGQNRAA